MVSNAGRMKYLSRRNVEVMLSLNESSTKLLRSNQYFTSAMYEWKRVWTKENEEENRCHRWS